VYVCADDELEEIDVVSVTSCGWSSDVPVLEALPARRQVLVLPAAESMSAQVAAMHNYSNPRCRPKPAVPRSTVSLSSSSSSSSSASSSCLAKYALSVAFFLSVI